MKILLENDAAVDIVNRRRQTPIHCAHNMNVARCLQQAMRERLEKQLSTVPERRNSLRRNSITRRSSTRTPKVSFLIFL